MSTDLQPELAEVLGQQEEYTKEPPVAVHLVEASIPLSVQGRPKVGGATRTRTGVTVAPIKLIAADPRRAQITLMSVGANMLFSLSSAGAQDSSTMALWPQNVPCVITARTDVYVAAAVGTTSISYVVELWAAGE